MGIMDKFKTLFTVEVEEDEPIKKEVIKVEIETPVEEVKRNRTLKRYSMRRIKRKFSIR